MIIYGKLTCDINQLINEIASTYKLLLVSYDELLNKSIMIYSDNDLANYNAIKNK